MRVSALLVLVPALLVSAAASLAGVAPALAQDNKPRSIYDVFGLKEPGFRGAELEAAVRTASAFPLGSEKNPVRAKGPTGQRHYIARLRCSDGHAPEIRGRAAAMPSPFGGINDQYVVDCKGGTPATTSITMDMYHDHVETLAVPGFTIVAP